MLSVGIYLLLLVISLIIDKPLTDEGIFSLYQIL